MKLVKSGQITLIAVLLVILLGLVAYKSYTKSKDVSVTNSSANTSGIVRDHNLTCDQLPAFSEVTKTLDANRELIGQLRRAKYLVSANEFTKDASMNTRRLDCPGKGDIVIIGTPVTSKAEIEAAIGDTFKGIPYRIYSM